jgi:hypothetical protein
MLCIRAAMGRRTGRISFAVSRTSPSSRGLTQPQCEAIRQPAEAPAQPRLSFSPSGSRIVLTIPRPSDEADAVLQPQRDGAGVGQEIGTAVGAGPDRFRLVAVLLVGGAHDDETVWVVGT